MNVAAMKAAVQLAQKVKYAIIATADAKGWPHMAAASRVGLTAEDHVVVAEWFCPGTLANLQSNPRVSLVVWDAAKDAGYQLVGEMEDLKEVGMLDGYSTQVEEKSRIPQVERQLVIHVDKVIEFKRAPHSDTEK